MKGCRPLTEEEVQAVARSFTGTLASRNRALFLLGVKSGFRIAELLSLRVRDVQQHGRIVERVEVARHSVKGKIESRSVPLHQDAKAALQEWLGKLADDPRYREEMFLFASRQGDGAISRVQAWRILERAFQRNEMTGKLGTHSLRKTFADRVYRRLGGDLVKTQRAMGHRNVNSTVSYLSFREEEIDAAILAA